MFRKWNARYRNMPLARRLTLSYFLIALPTVLLVLICMFLMQRTNNRYEEMIHSATVASQFSLSFKEDFDFESYLLIVENKTPEESNLDALLGEANRVVREVEESAGNVRNSSHLKSAKKYLQQLEVYKNRLIENIQAGDRYDQNLEILENDIKIVTGLVRDTMVEYSYYEIQGMHEARKENQRAYNRAISIFLVLFAVMVVIIVVMFIFIPRRISRPITILSEVTDQVAKGDLSVRAKVEAGAEIGVLKDSLNTMIDKISELLAQVKDEQRSLRNAELELLQSQINPHFLYNTLDTIVWLAETGEREKVVSMVGNLSNFFRTGLNNGKEIITVREELEHVKGYLAIQAVRYQDILRYEVNVPEELNDCLIPKISLQPLVENALYHGIKNKRGGGTITVTGELYADSAVLTVRDDGIGMTAERLEQLQSKLSCRNAAESEMFGAYNVHERIRLKFGEEYGLTYTSTVGEGTTVTVRLPRSFSGTTVERTEASEQPEQAAVAVQSEM